MAGCGGRQPSRHCARRAVKTQATFSSLRPCRTLKTEVKCKVFTSRSNPFVTSWSSDGDMQIFHVAKPPLRYFVVVGRSKPRREATFRHFVLVGRSKLWRHANFSRREASPSSLRGRRTLNSVVKCKFVTARSIPFLTSCLSEAQNCGKTVRR